jgi:hypothetical protein
MWFQREFKKINVSKTDFTKVAQSYGPDCINKTGDTVTIVLKEVIEELLELAKVKWQSKEAAKMLWTQVYLRSRIVGLPRTLSVIVRRRVEEVEEKSLGWYMESSNLGLDSVGILLELGDVGEML